MSYAVEEINGCTKKLAFNFPELDLSQEINQALKEKQKSVNLKGYRKGKAPLQMVEKLYKPQVESQALDNFIRNKIFEALQKEELRAIGMPALENTKYDAGKSISFDVVVETYPEFELNSIAGEKFTQVAFDITDQEVADVEKNYLARKAEMVEVKAAETTINNGHFAVLNFQGERADGSKPENMKGEEFVLEIGSGQFIPGFEEGMIGMKSGDKKSIELTFPDSYHQEDLRNEKVKFDVELLEIKEKKFPEMTEELAKEFGFENVEDLKTKTKQQLEQQKKQKSRQDLNNEILEKLIEKNKFDLPQALIDQQKKYLEDEMAQTLKQQGFNEQMIAEYNDKWAEDYDKKAEFQVRSGLILDKLAQEFNIEAGETELTAKIDDMVLQSGMKKEELMEYYTSNENLKKNLLYAIREEKTFDKIIESLKLETK